MTDPFNLERTTMEQSHSQTLGALAAALSKAQGEITGAKKGAENPFFKSKYADLAACWDACRDALSSHGIAVIQTTKPDPERVIVVTTLVHESGEWIRGELSMTPTKADPQGFGSCLTYARRYALAGIVGLAQVDDDAESATVRIPPKKQKVTLEVLRKALYAEDSVGVAEVMGELETEEKKAIWYDLTSSERAKIKAMEKEIRDAEAQPDPNFIDPTPLHNERADKENSRRAANGV